MVFSLGEEDTIPPTQGCLPSGGEDPRDIILPEMPISIHAPQRLQEHGPAVEEETRAFREGNLCRVEGRHRFQNPWVTPEHLVSPPRLVPEDGGLDGWQRALPDEGEVNADPYFFGETAGELPDPRAQA